MKEIFEIELKDILSPLNVDIFYQNFFSVSISKKRKKFQKFIFVEISQKQNLPFRDSRTINCETIRKTWLFLKIPRKNTWRICPDF